MAIINIDTEKLKSINSDIAILDNTLLNNYIPSLENELQAIYNNVQNTEVRGIINTINEKISTITSSLKTELPRLEEFLDTQITSYQLSVEETEAALTAVVSKMATVAGTVLGASATSSNGADSSATGESSEDMNYFERANADAAEAFGNNWDAYTDSFADYYQNTANSDGLIETVGNAVLDTVEAAVGTVWNTGTFVLNEAVTGVEWVGDVLFGDSGLGVIWDTIL